MTQRFLFGREEELALVAESRAGIRPAPAELAGAVIEEAATHLRHVPSPPPERRYFLANGGCLYEDLGHAELATAECADPVELAAHTIALRQVLAEATQTVGRVYGIPVHLVANNVDYAFSGSRTYGHHLNILFEGLTLERAVEQLAPLLAAMPVLAGTGKVSFARGSSGFELSQRAVHFTSLLSKRTTSNRGIVTAKDEALCVNGIRLHVISLDTALSPWQLALVPGILSLALKTAETGVDLAGPVALADPVRALQRVSADPSLKAGLPLRAGGTTTALEIHERYQTTVENCMRNADAPPWAADVVTSWGHTITSLREDPFREFGRIDWVTKLVLLTQLLERMDLDWHEFSRWTFALASVRRLKATWPEIDPLGLTSSPASRARIRRSALGILERHFAQNSLSWAQFPRIWNAANRLCQQCLRYHTLRPGAGLAPAPGSTGLVTEEMVERARATPPQGTRASVRGKAIAEAPPGSRAGWDFLQTTERRLDMADAFGEGACWKAIKDQVDREA